MWSNFSLRTKGFFVVSIPLCAMLVSFVFSYLLNREQDNASVSVEHGLRVQSELDHLLAVSTSAQTGVRAYLLTRDSTFLEPYHAARQSLPGAVTRLSKLVRDDPQKAAALRQVQTLVDANLAVLANLLEQQQGAGGQPLPSARDARSAQEGSKMDELRREIGTIDAQENQFRGERGAYLAKVERWRSMVNVGGVLVGLTGAFFAMRLFSNGIVRRALLLRQNADRLTRGLPLLALPETHDEIGDLARDLVNAGNLLQKQSSELDASLSRLRRSDSLYRALAHNFPNGSVSLFDHELRYLVADGRGLTEAGVSREDLEGRTLWEVFPPETAERLGTLYRSALEGKWQACEMSLAEGQYLVQTLPIEDEAGQIYAGLAVTQNITERKQNEAALHQAKDEAERANEAKSEFLSRMSHELRTPLNAILGFSQLLESEIQDERQIEYLKHVLKAGQHLLGLINEVLDIARIESGHMQFSIEPVGIRSLFAESISMLRPLAEKRHIELADDESEEAIHGFVKADQQRLRQIMLNLLSNAIKYNREAGRVSVRCERGGREGYLRLMVQDTGPGISAEQRKRLFVPFARLEGEHSRIEGTGLGLALSRQLVDAMGGSMGLDSVVGEGSTFWLELPQSSHPVQGYQPLALGRWFFDGQDASHQEATAYKLLYIEDNLANLNLVENVLRERPGIKLLTAMQGTMGLELAREHRPDLILLDIHLPDITGHEVLLRLRAETALQKVPVIIMSADATERQIARLKSAGADAYLTKPFKLVEFLRLVDEHTIGDAMSGGCHDAMVSHAVD